jgi:hypothetical protein
MGLYTFILYGCIITNAISLNRFLNRECTVEEMEKGREDVFKRQDKYYEFCRKLGGDCGLSPIEMRSLFTVKGYPVMHTCPDSSNRKIYESGFCNLLDFYANKTEPVDQTRRLTIFSCEIKGGRISEEQCLLMNRYDSLKTSGIPFLV